MPVSVMFRRIPASLVGRWASKGAPATTPSRRSLAVDSRLPLKVRVRGSTLLHDPLWNKGTAHGPDERERLGLRGLLPPRCLTMEQQVTKYMATLEELDSDVQKAISLQELHDRNETLFHRVLIDHIEQLAPLVYTPTVGRVCLEFGNRFRRPRGMYFSTEDKGKFATMLYNWPQRAPRICVVTDGSRILGLGDLGAHGMGIPIGKLALYCAAGGIPPHRVLPVMLDCGTDNEDLLMDPFYLGVSHPRLKGDDMMEMVDEFMAAMNHHFPTCLVQFEDFSSDNASEILARYREKTLCFNDDIQGTGCVALAGVLSALEAQGKPPETLKDQRFLVAGAGSAGLGVASMIMKGMEQQGLSEEEARRRFYVLDKDGLLGVSPARRRSLDAQQQEFMRTDLPDGMPLHDLAEAINPTVILGISTVGGLFDERLIRGMAAKVDRPIIFPLSNPTAKAECTFADAFEWTDGRVIFASGSPFEPFEANGQRHIPSQCNNMFIFPGLGLGASVAGCTKITDRTLYDISIALARAPTAEERSRGQIFPSVSRIREVSDQIAAAAIDSARGEGLTTKIDPNSTQEAMEFLNKRTYYPGYVSLGISQ